MKEERLFLAIGAADAALLERCVRRRPAIQLKWGFLAACLALILTAGLLASRPGPLVPQPDNSDAVCFAGSDAGVLHLAAAYQAEQELGNFSIYVNEENYYGAWEDGSYVVRPVIPAPEGLPECDLTITHWRNTSLWDTAELVLAKMSETYDVAFLVGMKEEDRTRLAAYNGTESGAEWDAANAWVTVIEDQEGGVYTLTARFFTEATEGHGAAFQDMADTFQPIPSSKEVPSWLASLREALSGVLTPDTWASVYGGDVSGQISISAIDIVPDDDEAPTSATITVRHRLSAEEPYDYLTMELSYTGGEWEAEFIGLER